MKYPLSVALLATFAPAASAGLPTGLSGAWYNPAQSGHGIHLTMLSGTAAHGAWNVYDAQGNPVHLYFEGHVDGDSIVAEAYSPRGMKFGSFDRSGFSAPRWGSLRFDFTDCDHATLTYTGDGPAGAGYANGSMPLARLTRAAGTTCSFARPAVNSGAYEGTWQWTHPGYTGDEFRLHAAVDRQGRLWATSAWTPGPTYVSAVGYPPVLIGSVPVITADAFDAAALGRENTAVTMQPANHHPIAPTLATLHFQRDADGAASITATDIPGLYRDFRIERAPGANVLDATAIDLGGRKFTFSARGQFFDLTRTISFGFDAETFCIVNAVNPAVCDFSGRITGHDEGLAMFDFYANANQGARFYGKGWLRSDTGQLVMVAEAGALAFGLVAVPKN